MLKQCTKKRKLIKYVRKCEQFPKLAVNVIVTIFSSINIDGWFEYVSEFNLEAKMISKYCMFVFVHEFQRIQ